MILFVTAAASLSTLAVSLAFLRHPHPDTASELLATRRQEDLAAICSIAAVCFWALIIVRAVTGRERSPNERLLPRWAQMLLGLAPLVIIAIFLFEVWLIPTWHSRRIEAAVAYDRPTEVRSLLAERVVLDDASVERLLYWAVEENHPDIVDILINQGVSPNSKVFGERLLVRAVGEGRTEIVRLLVRRGASVNTTGRDTLSTLEQAKRLGHQDIVAILRHAGASR